MYLSDYNTVSPNIPRLSKGSCCFAGTNGTTIQEISNTKNCSAATVAKIRYIPDDMYIHKYNMF